MFIKGYSSSIFFFLIPDGSKQLHDLTSDIFLSYVNVIVQCALWFSRSLVCIPFRNVNYICFVLKIKRCGELGRKLRYFKVQMLEAEVEASARSGTKSDLNFDDLEVYVVIHHRVVYFCILSANPCLLWIYAR